MKEMLEFFVRQSGHFINGGGSDVNYDGSNFLEIVQHIVTVRLRPFLGFNVGALYGDSPSDTWAVGIKGGLKFYV